MEKGDIFKTRTQKNLSRIRKVWSANEYNANDTDTLLGAFVHTLESVFHSQSKIFTYAYTISFFQINKVTLVFIKMNLQSETCQTSNYQTEKENKCNLVVNGFILVSYKSFLLI